MVLVTRRPKTLLEGGKDWRNKVENIMLAPAATVPVNPTKLILTAGISDQPMKPCAQSGWACYYR